MVQQPAVVLKLRRLVQSSMAKHSYESAVFFADKLVTLTNEEPEEIFRLAQVRPCDSQYRPLTSLAWQRVKGQGTKL